MTIPIGGLGLALAEFLTKSLISLLVETFGVFCAELLALSLLAL